MNLGDGKFTYVPELSFSDPLPSFLGNTQQDSKGSDDKNEDNSTIASEDSSNQSLDGVTQLDNEASDDDDSGEDEFKDKLDTATTTMKKLVTFIVA